jgi:hypothetical protein
MKALKNVFCLFALLPLIAAAQPAAIDNGLVAYYPFDGNTRDASGNGNDMFENATLGQDRFGAEKAAADLRSPETMKSGQNYDKGVNSLSISIWVYMRSRQTTYNQQVIIEETTRISPGDGINLNVYNGQLRWIISYRKHESNGVVAVDDSYLPLNKWTNILCTYNDGVGAIFIDGIRRGYRDDLIQMDNIGGHVFGGSHDRINSFDGLLDDIRFYNRALSASEVAQLYSWEAFGGKPSSYEFRGKDVEWTTAEWKAREAGGHLAVIETEFENFLVTEFLSNLDARDKRVWIGAKQQDDSPWEWVTGDLFSYDNIQGKSGGVGDARNRVLYMDEEGEWYVDKGSRPYSAGWGRPYLIEFPSKHGKRPALAEVEMASGFIVGCRIINTGEGYTRPPTISFLGGNAVEVAQAEGIIDLLGRLVAINITNAGSGYQSEPSVRIESPPSDAKLGIEISKIETIVPQSDRPRRAIATANVINGFLVSANILDGGAGYEQVPIVTVSDATGTGALAAATIENGVVTSVQFVKAGIGYSGKALIQFQSPPPNPDATPRVTEIEVSMQMAFPNNYYVIEASSDLNNWEQIVEPFFAEETTHTVKVEVGDGDMRYFRAIQLP